jgi:hypothetical protein
MTNNTDRSKEIEIPKDFALLLLNKAFAYSTNRKPELVSHIRQEDFIAGAEWAYRHLHPSPSGFFFARDSDCHSYMIPVELRNRFKQLNNRLPEIEGWDEYDYDNALNDEFGRYLTNGGIDHIEFIPIPGDK